MNTSLIPNSCKFFATLLRQVHGCAGDAISPSQMGGWDVLMNPRLNKGLAFTIEERQRLGLHGLMPACQRTQDQQAKIAMALTRRFANNLNKYMFLFDLKMRNEKLFFKIVKDNTEELMPILYTPTVGLVCQTYGLMYKSARGLFICKYDRGKIKNVLKNWSVPDIKAVCVTDGERILGLGDLGSFGMGIPLGKLTLYTALAGVRPHLCLPITLDIGTNNEELLEDPLYIGLREKRIKGDEYYSFIDEFVSAVVHMYGQDTLIQFEDFSTPNAFFLLDRYRNNYCTFNDDIQGTAAVILAGIKSSERLTGIPITQHIFFLFGAGTANMGFADLCICEMKNSGLSLEEARSRIWLFDIDGLITVDRQNLNPRHKQFAKNREPTKDLIQLIKDIKPSVLIGASASAGAFTPEVLSTMSQINKRPIIFALSNPTVLSECTAQQAYDHTEGRVIFSSGSPYPPVEYNGKTYHPGQGNNAYIFPGIALGVLQGVHHIVEEYFLIAAQTVADFVLDSDLQTGRLYPSLKNLQDVSLEIATRITEYAYCKGLASTYPEPVDKRKFIQETMYSTEYVPILVDPWPWPEAKSTKPIDERYIKTVGKSYDSKDKP